MFEFVEGGASPMGSYGSVTRIGNSLQTASDSRFVMRLYDPGLASQRDAVMTIAHELNHVRGFLRSGAFTDENTAEAAAQLAGKFFR